MKTVVLSPSSSLKSTATAAATDGDGQSESSGSCYFPGCRKDASCNCEMCLASINATLDIRPTSVKLSASKPASPTAVLFDPSVISTPNSNNSRVMVSPPLASTARVTFHENVKRKKKKKNGETGFGSTLMRLTTVLSLVLSAEYGIPLLISGIPKTELSAEMLRYVAEGSQAFQGLDKKLEFLQRELRKLVNANVLHCNSVDSVWKIDQDKLLLNSHCTLYKSATVEVSIWGWHLQSAGLLTAEFSPRGLTILSGRVTEWSDGKIEHSIRSVNQSWIHGKWSKSVVQLDPNTWILELQRSSIMETPRLISLVLHFLKSRLSKEFKSMKQEFWLSSAFGSQCNGVGRDTCKSPT